MTHLLDITLKDLTQILRDRKVFMFLLIMPIGFTLLFGFAFGGSNNSAESDPRPPVGYLDQDGSVISQKLTGLLQESSVIALVSDAEKTPADLQAAVAKGDLAIAVIVPAGYGEALLAGNTEKLTVFTQNSNTATLTAQAEIAAALKRILNAAQAARIVTAENPAQFDAAFADTLAAWQNPPVSLRIRETGAIAIEEEAPANPMAGYSHTAPGMMIQFAIAGLLTAAQVLVVERKNRCLPRMLTTSVSKLQILLGHYLAIFTLIFAQFLLLITFGQIVLKVNYLSQPLATLLVAFATAMCISALGLLIGVLAKSEEQAVAFSLIPMFVFSGLGGAWMPLEFTGPVFQTIGHASPVAWAMDGFKNITVRGFGLESVWMPALALVGYAALFLLVGAWRFRFETRQ
jgi:ABC-2 type transport system permease protein